MADGAPTLLSGMSAPAAARDTTDTARSTGAKSAEWGIFFNGSKALEPDSIVAMDYQREWSLLDYQVEQGAFETFNKVARPFDTRLRITKGGSQSDRTAFLAQVEALAESLNTYDVVTPERTYLSVNVSRLGYGRSARDGATLLIVDIGLRQIRTTAVAAFTQVASPSAASPVVGGTVQPVATPAPQKAIADAALKRQASLPLLALKGQLR
ncbi:MAG TPA: hypothetical protein VF453_06550 [Burkholderiaceae bacterium]